nr:hypothetical protein [uncultured Caldimonas sp.]
MSILQASNVILHGGSEQATVATSVQQQLDDVDDVQRAALAAGRGTRPCEGYVKRRSCDDMWSAM